MVGLFKLRDWCFLLLEQCKQEQNQKHNKKQQASMPWAQRIGQEAQEQSQLYFQRVPGGTIFSVIVEEDVFSA